MNFQDYNVLGTLIDDTFGKSNDINGSFKCGGKITTDERLTVTCMVVVNLLNRSEMNAEAKKAAPKAPRRRLVLLFRACSPGKRGA